MHPRLRIFLLPALVAFGACGTGDDPTDDAGGDGSEDTVTSDVTGETGSPDADAPDAEVPDAEVPDAEVPDADAPDADPPDAEVPDADDVGPDSPDTDASDAADSDVASDVEVNLCAAVDCTPLNDGCTIAACEPSTGECVTADADDGAACDVSGCLVDGVCEGGVCGGTPVEDGTVCDDGDPCTVEDSCVEGACGGSEVECGEYDGACVVGACDVESGECTAVPVREGDRCDTDACVTDQTCTEGVCSGGVGVDCTGYDDACNTGVCNPLTGTCEGLPAGDGTTCDDGGACTTGDVCTSGACVGSPADCTGEAGVCEIGFCRGDDGTCDVRPQEDGTACDDGNLCSVGTTCDGGACVGGLVDCSSLDDACNVGTCDAATGGCVAVPRVDGTACDDGSPCTTGDICSAGVCSGSALDCSRLDDACNIGVCDPMSGLCRAGARANGTVCEDGDVCTETDRCTEGTCAGVPLDCSAEDGVCTVGVCDPMTGSCTGLPAVDGTTCEDGDVCTSSDVCTGGTCGGEPLDCSAEDGVCTVGLCDPMTGACVGVPAEEGVACDDGDLCTSSDACTGGSCGGTELDCSVSSGCGEGTCDPGTGMCEVVGAEVCASCPEGVCALDGSCVPSLTEVLWDFESGEIPGGWTTAGDADWFASATTPHGGAWGLSSGDIGGSQRSSLIAPVNFPVSTQLSFWLRASSEADYDFLRLYIDGVEQDTWSGTVAWTRVSYELSAGPHTIEWRYTKDAITDGGSDTVWIDNVTVNTVPGRVDAAYLDFEGSVALPAGLTTSGDANWSVDSSTSSSGVNSAMNGDIGDNQSTTLRYDVSLPTPGGASFLVSVSSEASYDYLRLFVDGVEQDSWSGTVGWTPAELELTAGLHVIEWRYTKDISVSVGADSAWVDDIRVWYEGAVVESLCGVAD